MSRLSSFMNGEGRLKQFPAKRSIQLEAIAWLATKFEVGRQYTEKEVNEILNQWHTFGDPAMLRRDLFDLGYLDRTANGRCYWREDLEDETETPTAPRE